MRMCGLFTNDRNASFLTQVTCYLELQAIIRVTIGAQQVNSSLWCGRLRAGVLYKQILNGLLFSVYCPRLDSVASLGPSDTLLE